MALVVCPECNKEISQYAKICSDCGFPIHTFMEEHRLIDTTKILLCPKCGHHYGGFKNGKTPINLKCKFCNIVVVQTDVDWNEFYDEYGYEKEIEFTNTYGNNQFSQEAYEHRLAVIAEENRKHDIERKQKNTQSNVPKCPTCGSTDIEKISFTKKALSIGGLGILSNKIGKTYQCKNCKTTW